MNTKLSINLATGAVEAEGSEDFVRFIYQDFKDSLSKYALLRANPPLESQGQDAPLKQPLLTDESASAPKRAARKTKSGESSKARTGSYKPKFNNKLDLTGLEQAYDEWSPSNNFEKILLFAVFLRDKLKIEPCTADDIYTCFETLGRKGKTKVPEAFVQAFRDAQSRTNYIEVKSMEEIVITIPGNNRFNEKKHAKKDAS